MDVKEKERDGDRFFVSVPKWVKHVGRHLGASVYLIKKMIDSGVLAGESRKIRGGGVHYYLSVSEADFSRVVEEERKLKEKNLREPLLSEEA